uniref:N-ribosyldihydronicotinamide:quinone reductase 2 n=1 Tax=Varanus komodoensis TaxID=61221 RepID=A0A8D2KWY0_VARKO
MAGKKVLIIYAHQEPKSMNGSLKTIAVEELTKQGCSVTVSDLYEMQFEPRTTRKDIVGNLHNPEEFNYGVEAWEACKHGCLSEDLIEEQRKVKEADLVIFQNKLALLSFTTGGDKGMYSKGGASGDIRYLLWPMQHGILHFCGFSILTPQICYAPESMTEDERVQILSSWMKRLRTIWEEKPIKCTPEWYYQ